MPLKPASLTIAIALACPPAGANELAAALDEAKRANPDCPDFRLENGELYCTSDFAPGIAITETGNWMFDGAGRDSIRTTIEIVGTVDGGGAAALAVGCVRDTGALEAGISINGPVGDASAATEAPLDVVLAGAGSELRLALDRVPLDERTLYLEGTSETARALLGAFGEMEVMALRIPDLPTITATVDLAGASIMLDVLRANCPAKF